MGSSLITRLFEFEKKTKKMYYQGCNFLFDIAPMFYSFFLPSFPKYFFSFEGCFTFSTSDSSFFDVLISIV